MCSVFLAKVLVNSEYDKAAGRVGKEHMIHTNVLTKSVLTVNKERVTNRQTDRHKEIECFKERQRDGEGDKDGERERRRKSQRYIKRHK